MNKVKIKAKIYIVPDDESIEGSFGPGSAELLEGIEKYGSLNKATKEMNMAYSKAWKVINSAEDAFGFELIERLEGAKGSVLTDKGKEILKKFRELEKEIYLAGNNLLNKKT